jgi:hypothetical protein
LIEGLQLPEESSFQVVELKIAVVSELVQFDQNIEATGCVGSSIRPRIEPLHFIFDSNSPNYCHFIRIFLLTVERVIVLVLELPDTEGFTLLRPLEFQIPLKNLRKLPCLCNELAEI